MFESYKFVLINYLLMILLTLIIVTIQSSIRISFFGIYLSLPLWIPLVIYWITYRQLQEAVGMVYFVTFAISSASTISLGELLMIHSFIFLVLLFFKRVYYANWVFFSIACGVSLTFFPFFLWGLSKIMGQNTYFPRLISWLLGGTLSWGLSFPLLGLLRQIDRWSLLKQKGTKRMLLSERL